MYLLMSIIKTNRKVVEAMTGWFYPLGCILFILLGAGAIAPEPVLIKPMWPEWEAWVFILCGFVAFVSYSLFIVDQIVSYIIEKKKLKKE